MVMLGLFMVCLLQTVRAQNTQNEPDPLQNLVDRIGVHDSFSLRFRQSIENATSGQTIHARGLVYIDKPNRFRWDYETDPRNIIACDGTYLWLILPEDKQVMVDLMARQPLLWSPFSILTHPNRLTDEFRVEPVKDSDETIMTYRLTPVTPNNQYRFLHIGLGSGGGAVKFTLVVFDSMGNQNLLFFDDLTPTGGKFDFQPPVPDGFTVTDFAGQPAQLPQHGPNREDNSDPDI